MEGEEGARQASARWQRTRAAEAEGLNAESGSFLTDTVDLYFMGMNS